MIGGLGEVGSALARHILVDPAATVIVYDSAAPQSISAAQREALADLRAAGGSRFRLVTADATDDARLREVVAQMCADHGRIAGVVYAPGMSAAAGMGRSAANRTLRRRTSRRRCADCRRWTVRRRVRRSTAASSSGRSPACSRRVGSGAYTAANTYLDRYVKRRNRDAELPWRNVIWEHWITGGSGGAAMRDDHGCTAEQACLLYDALIGDDRTGPVAISIDDLNDRAARARSVEQAKTQRAEPDLAVPTGTGQPRPTLSTA